MIKINGLSEKTVDAIRQQYRDPFTDVEHQNFDNLYTVSLTQTAAIKCYNLDGTIVIDIGGSIFSLERNDYMTAIIC